ncbi:hypothetical protein Tco_0023451 [Tanacetum coccineum]
MNAFRGVFNLGPAGDWITFFKRDNVVHAEYPALVDEANMGDRKSFKDPLSYIVRRDPLYQRLARHPIDVQTFPKQILYMAGIAERNDKDIIFTVKSKDEDSFGIGSPLVFINHNDVDRKGQGLSEARPSSKRRMQLPTLPSRTIRQKVIMLPTKHSKGKVAASEPLDITPRVLGSLTPSIKFTMYF